MPRTSYSGGRPLGRLRLRTACSVLLPDADFKVYVTAVLVVVAVPDRGAGASGALLPCTAATKQRARHREFDTRHRRRDAFADPLRKWFPLTPCGAARDPVRFHRSRHGPPNGSSPDRVARRRVASDRPDHDCLRGDQRRICGRARDLRGVIQGQHVHTIPRKPPLSSLRSSRVRSPPPRCGRSVQ